MVVAVVVVVVGVFGEWISFCCGCAVRALSVAGGAKICEWSLAVCTIVGVVVGSLAGTTVGALGTDKVAAADPASFGGCPKYRLSLLAWTYEVVKLVNPTWFAISNLIWAIPKTE